MNYGEENTPTGQWNATREKEKGSAAGKSNMRAVSSGSVCKQDVILRTGWARQSAPIANRLAG